MVLKSICNQNAKGRGNTVTTSWLRQMSLRNSGGKTIELQYESLNYKHTDD